MFTIRVLALFLILLLFFLDRANSTKRLGRFRSSFSWFLGLKSSILPLPDTPPNLELEVQMRILEYRISYVPLTKLIIVPPPSISQPGYIILGDNIRPNTSVVLTTAHIWSAILGSTSTQEFGINQISQGQWAINEVYMWGPSKTGLVPDLGLSIGTDPIMDSSSTPVRIGIRADKFTWYRDNPSKPKQASTLRWSFSNTLIFGNKTDIGILRVNVVLKNTSPFASECGLFNPYGDSQGTCVASSSGNTTAECRTFYGDSFSYVDTPKEQQGCGCPLGYCKNTESKCDWVKHPFCAWNESKNKVVKMASRGRNHHAAKTQGVAPTLTTPT